MKALKGKRGFSLVEVAVALAMITLVTITAVSIVLSSLRTAERNIQADKAEYCAADALQSFKTAASEEEFVSAMAFAGYDLKSDAQEGQYYFEFEGSGYRVEFALSFTGTPKLGVTVKKGESVVSEYTYTKG